MHVQVMNCPVCQSEIKINVNDLLHGKSIKCSNSNCDVSLSISFPKESLNNVEVNTKVRD